MAFSGVATSRALEVTHLALAIALALRSSITQSLANTRKQWPTYLTSGSCTSRHSTFALVPTLILFTFALDPRRLRLRRGRRLPELGVRRALGRRRLGGALGGLGSYISKFHISYISYKKTTILLREPPIGQPSERLPSHRDAAFHDLSRAAAHPPTPQAPAEPPSHRAPRPTSATRPTGRRTRPARPVPQLSVRPRRRGARPRSRGPARAQRVSQEQCRTLA